MATTGEWLPPQTAQPTLNTERLRALANISTQGQLDQLETLLEQDEQSALIQSMQASREQWQSAATPLSDDELIDLIKALAIAEMRFPECNLGAKSVVIHINRLLKQRGSALSKDDLHWLKQHSNNRFLPNAPIL